MLPSSSSSPSSLSLRTYLQVLRRRRRLILVVTLAVAGLATLPALLADPVYSSTARVRVSALDEEGVFQPDSTNASQPADRFRELANEIEVLRSTPIRTAVLAQLDAGASAFGGPTVEPVGFSEVVEITITAGDPGTAADVANAFADVFIEDRRERSIEALASKADELRDQSAEATAELEAISQRLVDEDLTSAELANLQLRQSTLVAQVQDYDRRADELGVEVALRGRGTQLIAPAELALQPISSSPLSAAVLGLALGFLLALAVAVVVDTVQDRVGSRDDLAEVHPDAPILATVPHTDETDPAGAGSFATTEAYRYLRTGVRIFGLNATLRSVLVTSAVGGEGKTTTATNLARAMAEAGDRVVLVDGDLRRPTLHQRFELPNHQGLSSLVVGDAVLDDVVHFVADNLAVVTSGPPVQNPTEVLGSTQFAAVLNAIVDQADFTILDSPPVLPVADALIAGQQVDGVLVVARIGEVRRRALRDLFHRLDEAQVPLVGLVANDTSEESPYGYYDAEVAATNGSSTAGSSTHPAPTPSSATSTG